MVEGGGGGCVWVQIAHHVLKWLSRSSRCLIFLSAKISERLNCWICDYDFKIQFEKLYHLFSYPHFCELVVSRVANMYHIFM